MTSRPVPTIGALLLAAALSGCGGSGLDPGAAWSAPPISTAAQTATATVTDTSTSGELTDPELLWLAQFNRTARALMDAPGKGPATIETSSQMRKEADTLRDCGRALEGMTNPGPRLRSVYGTFTDACAHFDRAATCALTIAPYMKGVDVGSPEDRRLNEASDCFSTESKQGSEKLADAYSASIDLLTDAPST